MTRRGTWTRRVAGSLVRYAARVMPVALKDWAKAMQNELAYVADDREALRWAAGCVGSAHAASLRHLYLLDVPAVRVAGVMLAAYCAFEMTFATAMTLAYRVDALRIAETLGRMTPGDGYHRFIPLMEALPGWLHGLVIATGVCHLFATFLLLSRRRAAYIALLLAVGLTLVTRLVERPVIDAVGIAVMPNPSLLVGVLLPIVFPLLLACAAWSGSRRDSADAGVGAGNTSPYLRWHRRGARP